MIRVAARNTGGLDARPPPADAAARALPARPRRAGAQHADRAAAEDIAAHYDLGNELFELMLDPTMMYSCAVFERPAATLEEASAAKLELVCDKLDLGPDDHVLEIGTGWGGFAVHAARTRGCRVTTTTISREQHDARRARACARPASRTGSTVLIQDYRELRGTYDKLVSIEMIEAVGWQDFGTFFARCSELLVPDGAMLLQAIVIDDRAYEVEKASKTFIRTYVFPNGCLPSLEVIARCAGRRTDMRTVHLEDLTPHYARDAAPLARELRGRRGRLEALGYDERFRRLWRLYLAYCEAGFAERRIGLVQPVLAKPRWRGTITASAPALAQPTAIAAG